MSKKLIQSIILGGLIPLLFAGCDKEVVTKLEENFADEGQANMKVIHASAYATNYTMHLKVNGVRVSYNFTNSTPFPGGGLNTGGANSPWYMQVTPGNNTPSLAIPKAGSNADSVSIFNGTVNVEAGKHYSAFITDTAAKTQIVMLTDNLALPADGKSRYRFLNIMPNQPSLDLYFGSTKVASDVAYKTTSPDFLLNWKDTARWYLRPAGALPTS